MTFELFLQSLAVLFGLLPGWAWAKSAMLQLKPNDAPKGWIDRRLERISKKPEIWNAVAAFQSAGAAISAALAYLAAQ